LLPPPTFDPGFTEWKAVMDRLPVIAWTALPDGAVEFVNKRLHEVTGLDDTSVLHDRWRRITHPDDLLHASFVFAVAADSGESFSVDTRALCADGHYRWFRTHATPVRAGDGAIVRWFGVAIDIDVLKQAERALETSRAEIVRSERHFRALADAVPVIVWTADAKGWIDWYNRRWFEYTGQTAEQAAGWGWQAAHHPDDFPEVMRRWPESIASGQPFEMEFRLRDAHGSFRWFLTRVHPLRDDAGQIVRWYGSNADIDDQKRALEKSRLIANTLQELLIPTEFPERSGIRFDGLYRSAESETLVGGDWYDVFELPNGEIVFTVGDVAGHGLSASLMAAKIRQAIITLAFEVADPARILEKLNRILWHQKTPHVTALVGIIDATASRVTFASAGHPPLFLAVTPDEPARSLDHTGLALAIEPEISLSCKTVDVRDGAVFAAYTDGLIEFERDIFTAERRLSEALAQLLAYESIAKPASAVRRRVMGDATNTDDVALLIIQFGNVESHNDEVAPFRKTWRFHSSDAYMASRMRKDVMHYIVNLAEDGADLFAAELILGELLANTVEHAPGLVEIDIDWTGEKPRVRVRDNGPGFESLNSALPDAFNEGGRGMFLFTTLAECVRVRPIPLGGMELAGILPIRRRPNVSTASENSTST
jgi:PAS domain S-box-containing protein